MDHVPVHSRDLDYGTGLTPLVDDSTFPVTPHDQGLHFCYTTICRMEAHTVK